ncbi:hypothetical protein [uncultured Lacinutrix sp.]|uniref:hypothetical protein n=1 Tax=uncultured Lacinutrix sp. TaxID=574032 RepID=UPI0026399739|nr:hypothetical protein [uncultured Lacinutrix sp.]
MEKLNKEEIQFIDNYLDNSDIVYGDVRLEIVDHIATDIECQINAGDNRSFYDIFKAYMIDNKSLILNNHKAFKKATDKKIIKTLFNQLLSFKGILFFISMGFILYIGINYLEVKTFNRILISSELLIQIGVLVLILITYKKNKIRYSALERALVLYVIYIFGVFNLKYNASFWGEFVYVFLLVKAFLVMLPILFLMTAIKFKNDYEIKFKSIL